MSTHQHKSNSVNLQDLNHNFAIPDVISFDEIEPGGLIRVSITSAACTAALYLQGAHLAQWQPAGHEPGLFLSERSAFLPGKAIRGGVPIIFPWFGARTATQYSPRTDGPSHGFARTSEWQLAAANIQGDDVHLTLTLDPTDTTRALGYDLFHLTYRLVIGAELDLQLTVENQSTTAMHFEEALHSYFMVGDAEKITISGLANTEYLDKTDGFKQKRQHESVLRLTGETDRPYLDTTSPVDLDDSILKRRITVDKLNSKTTVVWNPWSELTAKLADMSADGWHSMTCIETANAGSNAVILPPGDQHTMHAHIIIKDFKET
jgi:glucose-6-phosphate 1-epimerase